MARPKVIITRKLPEAAELRARELFDVELNAADTQLDAAGLARAMREADGLIPCVADKITAELLAASGRRVKIVSNYGVGYNNIDVDAAKANGVVVTNTPDVLTEDTADLALTLMLATARRAGEGEREVRSGKWTGWRPTHMLATRVNGKTLGLIGIGRIGRAVARRAHHGFGMRVLYHDPFPLSDAEAASIGAERRESIEAVLAESDFVSLHCPATPETKHLMNAARFAQMRNGAILINTARGDVVNEGDLIDALRSGAIAGAGLDVFEKEPVVPDALKGMENVVLLPHLGSATMETRVAMGMRALDNLEAFFGGRAPRDRVA
ncbi:MAG TPA: D-glycerate dehydrogenase [Gemmatimonadaceae bacterium]|jgi:lactate dehydrogenase-like 2-hydroxyacid dehydrogenase